MCDACGLPHPLCLCGSGGPPAVGHPSAWIRRREEFYARAIGPPREPAVYHWDDDRDPHVDVYVHSCGGTEVVVTGGLSDRPMPGMRIYGGLSRRVELLVRTRRAEDWLPPLLREIATLPFGRGRPLLPGAIVEGSREIRPGSLLRHALLAPTPGISGYIVDGEEVAFLTVCFLTDAEFRFAFRDDSGEILERLHAAGALQFLYPDRDSVVPEAKPPRPEAGPGSRGRPEVD